MKKIENEDVGFPVTRSSKDHSTVLANFDNIKLEDRTADAD